MTGWRDVLRIHPATACFPPLSPDELATLADDIKQHGMSHMPVLYRPKCGSPLLLDGTNRLDAAERAGIAVITDGNLAITVETIDEAPGFDPWAYVISANITRRHLTGEALAAVIRKLHEQRGDLSTRALAKLAGTSKDTVHRAISPVVSTATPAAARRVTGRDGKSYPATKAAAKPKATWKEPPIAGELSDKERKRILDARPNTIVQLAHLLTLDSANTLDELVRTLGHAQHILKELPLQRRITIVRGFQQALGVTEADLRPIT